MWGWEKGGGSRLKTSGGVCPKLLLKWLARWGLIFMILKKVLTKNQKSAKYTLDCSKRTGFAGVTKLLDQKYPIHKTSLRRGGQF